MEEEAFWKARKHRHLLLVSRNDYQNAKDLTPCFCDRVIVVDLNLHSSSWFKFSNLNRACHLPDMIEIRHALETIVECMKVRCCDDKIDVKSLRDR